MDVRFTLPIAFLIVSFTSLIHSKHHHDNHTHNYQHNNYEKPILGRYDFIVIGAGVGGCVVANRLTEKSTWSVLLLEAGQDETIDTDIPLAATFFQSTEYDWGYTSEPSPNGCLGFKNGRCPWPRGKGMGGSSIINFMLYTRGRKEDYDRLVALGNRGWSYADVLPYFLKSENNSVPEYQNSPFHSHSGNVHVERVRYHSILVDKFIDAGGELGLKKNIDYTVNPENGISRFQATTLNGRRVSASKAYIRPVKNRHNLQVSMFSQVTRIIISSRTKKAIGVEFEKDGKTRKVFAGKEVILSAGSVNSPQLLMLSGIGPKDHLQYHGIPVIQDLPVGQNLQDHYGTTGVIFESNVTEPPMNEQTISDPNYRDQWFNYGQGPLTVPAGVDGIAYIRTPSGKDVELVFAPLGRTSNTFELSTMLLHPAARGNITLRDKNPRNPPVIRYGYFDHKSDLYDNVYALKYIVRLIEETRAFRDIGPKLKPYENCQQFEFKSDDYFSCLSKYMSTSYYHPCNTCGMGHVVDNRLQVLGVQGLRVVDSSILSYIPSSHLYAPTLMVGEKASDIIKSHYGH